VTCSDTLANVKPDTVYVIGNMDNRVGAYSRLTKDHSAD